MVFGCSECKVYEGSMRIRLPSKLSSSYVNFNSGKL